MLVGSQEHAGNVGGLGLVEFCGLQVLLSEVARIRLVAGAFGEDGLYLSHYLLRRRRFP